MVAGWNRGRWAAALAGVVVLGWGSVAARGDSFFFSTGNVDGSMAAASRPGLGGKIEIEAGDDFVTTAGETSINHATFTGLIVPSSNGLVPTIGDVDVEIYRVFPKDSDVGRTPNVNTRTNSPSDLALDARDAAAAELTLVTTTVASPFMAANSVLNGIDKAPNQRTGGEGPVTGAEVKFSVDFATPFDLPADHYFFVPQVQVTGGEFYWLSSARPIMAPGTPFPAGATDLQAWIRNADLDPDWSRVGTDIVGGSPAPTFNMAFTLDGTVAAPAPGGVGAVLAAIGMMGVGRWGVKRRT